MAGYESISLPITSWAEEDRPREKLLSKGKSVLSDAELIAILIGSGYKEKSAVEVAKILLSETGNDLARLAQMNEKQLMKVKGIGEAKAITIMAALELGRRRKDQEKTKAVVIKSSRDSYEYFYPLMADLAHEEFYVLLLARNNSVMRHLLISKGGVSGTVVDSKMIFKPAMEDLASGIILCHNHPSGNTQPSEADVSLTKKIKEAGKQLDVNVLDHIIFTNKGFYSFADEGML